MESNHVRTPELEYTPGAFPVSPVSLSPPRPRQDAPDSPLDPDSFYRTFDPPQSSSQLQHAQTLTNATYTSPRSSTSNHARLSNGSNAPSSLPRPTAAVPGAYNFRSNLRSITNPAAGSTASGGKRSASSSVSNTAQRNGINVSVMDRARQFEQPAAQRSTPTRQPLFGEVITVTKGEQVGHGIPSNYVKRSTSESNMQSIQSPPTSPLSTRTRTRLDIQLQKANAASLGMKPQSPHSRSASEGGESPIEQAKGVNGGDRSSQFQLPARSFESRPPARPPTKPRRYSASTEHLSSSRNGFSSSLPRPTTPQSTAGSTSSRRYVRSPDQPPVGSTHAVNAVIKELPDKTATAPSLRSSRPRVPVSSASTASSRAKQAERSSSKSSARSSSPGRTAPASTSRDRRTRTAGMLRAAEQVREKSRSRNRKPNFAATDSESSLEIRAGEGTGKELTNGQETRGGLQVNTNKPETVLNEVNSATTDMEIDESPILGRTVYQPVGQRHDRIQRPSDPPREEQRASYSALPSKLSPIEASPDPNELAHVDFEAIGGAEQPLTPMESTTYEPSQEVLDALSFGGGDEGTIRVQLRGTPVIEPTSWPAAAPTSVAVPVDGNIRDSGIGSSDVDHAR